MSLVSRLCRFFLTALAVVLVGFSVALYLLAAKHLHRQVDERLDAALAMLAAAAEVGSEGVEWEPGERALGLGRDTGPDQIRWMVCDERGNLVDRSANLNPRRFLHVPLASLGEGEIRDRDHHSWQTKIRRLTHEHERAAAVHAAAKSSVKDDDETAAARSHATLTFIALAPLGPTEATLQRLPLTLAGLSAVLWGLSALAGRRLCRRALAPLTRMAAAARDSDAADPGSRLPLPGTSDELEDLGLAFNGLLDRLHEALERQRRFTGNASHQLRTPLTGLLSQVDVALRQDRPPSEYQRVLGVVRNKATQLRQILESLLFLARTESEAGRPDLAVVDLADWLPEHLHGWSGHHRADDLRFSRECEGPLGIRAHPHLLAQLVDNLIENACKYSPTGTPVTIRLSRRSGSAELSVEDRGCGLSVEERALVFQPFYRAPAARSRGWTGVGLGLAVADRIVAVFNGTIGVASEPGAGSRFTITFPEVLCVSPTASPADLVSPHAD